MEYLVTAEEMKRYDRVTIGEIGIPALVLMERAALAVMEEIAAVCRGGRVLILAGVGNNGGDGLALARLLAERGYQVEVAVCGDPGRATEEWKTQEAVLRNYPVRIMQEGMSAGRKTLGKEYTILVDALFGVGLSREVSGKYREQIEQFNGLSGYKIAVDVPSGIHSDTGEVCGCAVKADLTVCLGMAKRGLYFYPGCEYCGIVKVKEIGIGEAAFRGVLPQMYRYTERIEDLLPVRKGNGNKGTFGKVLLAAGSRNMAGAAVLAARGCYKSGAGMVKVATPECNRIVLQAAVPEALLWTYGEENEDMLQESDLERTADWADVLAVGPGLGTGEGAYRLLKLLLERSGQPIVIDADGLNLLAEYPDLKDLAASRTACGRRVVLTPHLGELSRLTGESIHEIRFHPVDSVMGLARRLHCVVAGKDARTVICQEGRQICLNTTGNSGMATAGSGDVLAGMIAGLLAQGMEPFEAAAVGVYWHGLAGDAAAAACGEYGVTAYGITEHIICGRAEK